MSSTINVPGQNKLKHYSSVVFSGVRGAGKAAAKAARIAAFAAFATYATLSPTISFAQAVPAAANVEMKKAKEFDFKFTDKNNGEHHVVLKTEDIAKFTTNPGAQLRNYLRARVTDYVTTLKDADGKPLVPPKKIRKTVNGIMGKKNAAPINEVVGEMGYVLGCMDKLNASAKANKEISEWTFLFYYPRNKKNSFTVKVDDLKKVNVDEPKPLAAWLRQNVSNVLEANGYKGKKLNAALNAITGPKAKSFTLLGEQVKTARYCEANKQEMKETVAVLIEKKVIADPNPTPVPVPEPEPVVETPAPTPTPSPEPVAAKAEEKEVSLLSEESEVSPAVNNAEYDPQRSFNVTLRFSGLYDRTGTDPAITETANYSKSLSISKSITDNWSVGAKLDHTLAYATTASGEGLDTRNIKKGDMSSFVRLQELDVGAFVRRQMHSGNVYGYAQLGASVSATSDLYRQRVGENKFDKSVDLGNVIYADARAGIFVPGRFAASAYGSTNSLLPSGLQLNALAKPVEFEAKFATTTFYPVPSLSPNSDGRQYKGEASVTYILNNTVALLAGAEYNSLDYVKSTKNELSGIAGIRLHFDGVYLGLNYIGSEAHPAGAMATLAFSAGSNSANAYGNSSARTGVEDLYGSAGASTLSVTTFDRESKAKSEEPEATKPEVKPTEPPAFKPAEEKKEPKAKLEIGEPTIKPAEQPAEKKEEEQAPAPETQKPADKVRNSITFGDQKDVTVITIAPLRKGDLPTDLSFKRSWLDSTSYKAAVAEVEKRIRELATSQGISLDPKVSAKMATAAVDSARMKINKPQPKKPKPETMAAASATSRKTVTEAAKTVEQPKPAEVPKPEEKKPVLAPVDDEPVIPFPTGPASTAKTEVKAEVKPNGKTAEAPSTGTRLSVVAEDEPVKLSPKEPITEGPMGTRTEGVREKPVPKIDSKPAEKTVKTPEGKLLTFGSGKEMPAEMIIPITFEGGSAKVVLQFWSAWLAEKGIDGAASEVDLQIRKYVQDSEGVKIGSTLREAKQAVLSARKAFKLE